MAGLLLCQASIPLKAAARPTAGHKGDFQGKILYDGRPPMSGGPFLAR